MPSSLAISTVLTCLSRLTFTMISSDFLMIGRPEQDSSFTSKFPARKRANHFCAADFDRDIFIVNSAHFFTSLCSILAFIVVMLQNVANFFLIYLHFQNKITFDPLHRSIFFDSKQRLKCHFLNAHLVLPMRLVVADC